MPADPPDPGVLFDTIMVRKEFKPHPDELSSMLFYLASIIIHGWLLNLRLSYEDWWLTLVRSLPHQPHGLKYLDDVVVSRPCTALRE